MRDFGAQIQQTCRFAARYVVGRVEGPAFRACPFLHDRGIETSCPHRFPCVGVRRGLQRADGRTAGRPAGACRRGDRQGGQGGVRTELVPEITEEPDYDKAVEAVKAN